MTPPRWMRSPDPVARRGSPPSSRLVSPPAVRRTATCTSPGLSRAARSASSVLMRWSSGGVPASELASAPRPPAPVGPPQPSESTTTSSRAPTPIGRNLAIWTLLSTALLRVYGARSEEHTSELQSQSNLVCRLLLEKKKKKQRQHILHPL